MIIFHAQDLKAILDALQSHCSPPKESADRINYDDFCVVRDMVKDISSIALPYFTASVFLKVCLSDSSHRAGDVSCVYRAHLFACCYD